MGFLACLQLLHTHCGLEPNELKLLGGFVYEDRLGAETDIYIAFSMDFLKGLTYLLGEGEL